MHLMNRYIGKILVYVILLFSLDKSYGSTIQDYYKPSSYVEQRSTVPTSNSIDIKRYNELLDRRYLYSICI